MNKNISVIIPVYNEGEYIKPLIEEVSKAQNILEIIVVNDGSRSEFQPIYDSLKGVTLINQKNGGKDKAILSGFNASKGDYILVLDADLINISYKQIEALSTYIPDKKIIAIARGGDYTYAKIIGVTYLTMGEHLVHRDIIEKYQNRLFTNHRWTFDNELNNIQNEIPKNQVKYLEFKNVKHKFKSKRYGAIGIWLDIKMLYQVYIVRYKLIGAFITMLRNRDFVNSRDFI